VGTSKKNSFGARFGARKRGLLSGEKKKRGRGKKRGIAFSSVRSEERGNKSAGAFRRKFAWKVCTEKKERGGRAHRLRVKLFLVNGGGKEWETSLSYAASGRKEETKREKGWKTGHLRRFGKKKKKEGAVTPRTKLCRNARGENTSVAEPRKPVACDP